MLNKYLVIKESIRLSYHYFSSLQTRDVSQLCNRPKSYETRFVTKSLQLCSKSFLFPEIRVYSFSYSSPLVGFKLVYENTVIMSFGSLHVSSLCGAKWNIPPLIFFFFKVMHGKAENTTKFSFMATILQLKVATRQIYAKIELGALHGCT